MKFAVLSDIHYISRRRMLPGTPDDVRIRPSASETALRMAAETKDSDVILLTGDLTDEGDIWSHEDLIEILKGLKQKGKRIFVTTATHDFHHHRAYTRCYNDTKVDYKSHPWHTPYFDPDTADYRALVKDEYKWLDDASITPKLVRCASPGELWDLYADFGRNQAFSVCDEAYSYCVELDDKTWCIMLNDNFRSIEGRHNQSVTYPPACLRWIRELVCKAKDEGKFIFACTHHPLLPPVPAYKIGADYRNMREAAVGHQLADLGIQLVFTGHTHFADVGFMQSENGNLLCDISTPSVRYYPPQFNVVTLDGEQHKVQFKSVELKTVDGFDLGKQTFKEYIRKNFEAEYRAKIKNMQAPLNTIIPALQVKHVYPLCKHLCKLSKADYDQIKNVYAFDIIMDLVHHMLGGDGCYTPDTPMFRFVMALAAVLDSIINTIPFKDVKRDILKGYTVSEVLEPMLFNNYIPDNNADFDFTVLPSQRHEVPHFTSHAGEFLMILLSVVALPFTKIAPIASAAALPLLTVKKILGEKKHPSSPERY